MFADNDIPIFAGTQDVCVLTGQRFENHKVRAGADFLFGTCRIHGPQHVSPAAGTKHVKFRESLHPILEHALRVTHQQAKRQATIEIFLGDNFIQTVGREEPRPSVKLAIIDGQRIGVSQICDLAA